MSEFYNAHRTRAIQLYELILQSAFQISYNFENAQQSELLTSLLFWFIEYREPPCSDYWIRKDEENIWLCREIQKVVDVLKQKDFQSHPFVRTLDYLFRSFQATTFSENTRLLSVDLQKSWVYADDELEDMIRMYYKN